ncbi:MAG: YHYH protein [Chthoniobacterales bacterium]|nr:YHYH protein [Chthoniobacterales bacterium]
MKNISTAFLIFSLSALDTRSAPLAMDNANPVNFTNGTARIVLSGENGVQYFVRSTTSLTNAQWKLAQTNPIIATGAIQTNDVPLGDPSSAQAFFRAESAYEQRARLFMTNYRKQLANGGPAVLTVNGTDVQNSMTMTEDRTNNQIVITGNGVPNYTPTIMGFNVTAGWNTAVSGGFQTFKLSENNAGASGGNNPNAIAVATETFRIPLNPVNNATATDTSLGTVGVAVNGIPIYNPFEDQNQTAATGRIFSGCCGHPQLNGIYHYHKYPACLRFMKGDVWQSEKDKCDEIDALVASGGHSPLIGFALDGWPVYGPVGWKDTNRTSKLLKSSYTGASDTFGNPSYVAASGDLDDCNGLVSPTPEYPEGIYHYVMSLEAGTNGTVVREISPYFGYDVRNTLNKYGLMPSGWTNDTAYANALKAGFIVNGAVVPGTDNASFTTFNQFVTNLVSVLAANGMSNVAAEFYSMKISYPFTIRKYRGTPWNAAGGGGGTTANGGVTAIAPSSGQRGQSYFVIITLQALPNTPGLPPTTAPITAATVGGIALTSPTRASTTTVSGTLTIPTGTATGGQDIVVTFQGPVGQPAPSYTGTGLFQVTAPTYADSAVNYLDWTNGSTGGTGFGVWTLSATGNAGTFLGGTSDTFMNVGASAGFGLWANGGGVATASRNMTNPLGTGDNFTLRFDNNYVAVGGQVSFVLTDASNVVRFRFYFVGGENTYRITDATTGRITTIPWTEAGLTVSFTQTSPTAYSLTAGSSTITGTLVAGGAISRVVVENNNAGSGYNHNLYFGEMTITDAP